MLELQRCVFLVHSLSLLWFFSFVHFVSFGCLDVGLVLVRTGFESFSDVCRDSLRLCCKVLDDGGGMFSP